MTDKPNTASVAPAPAETNLERLLADLAAQSMPPAPDERCTEVAEKAWQSLPKRLEVGVRFPWFLREQ